MPFKKNAVKYLNTHNEKLVWFYFKLFLPLVLLLMIYALIFQAVANNFDATPRKVAIQKNSSANSDLFLLCQRGLVLNKPSAKIALLITGWHKSIHAGRYTLSPNQSLQDIFAVLRGKKGLSEDASISVVVPEGFSYQEIIERLLALKVINKPDYVQFLANLNLAEWHQRYTFLDHDKLQKPDFLEGYLYPDTYSFAESSNVQYVLETMLDNFQRKALPLLQQRDSRYSLHQLLTLASIVEKEAVDPSERSKIAGIFLQRLKIRMHLQSCPTVKYALHNPHKKFLLYKDLNVVSPYNTYRHYGLPPGPICSPGAAAIQAVLNPESTDMLYFVARGDGTHIFAKTLKEHLQNKNNVDAEKIY